MVRINFISSPELKAHGELIVYQSSRRPSVRPSGFTMVYLCCTFYKKSMLVLQFLACVTVTQVSMSKTVQNGVV